MGERRWRVGELAEAAGMTVRTLHHYEQIGLLVPAARTSGDHRLYGEADVERLYRIRALRGLGMSLDDIRKALDDGPVLADVLRAHLDRIELELERIALLRDRLRSITSDGRTSSADLLATLNAMSRVERHAHARRTRNEGDHEDGRERQGDHEGDHEGERESDHDHEREHDDVERRWRAIADRLRACMAAGDAPASERARTAASEARELIEAFAEGDAAILEDLARLRQNDPPRNLAGWDPELTRYLDLALAALSEASGVTQSSDGNLGAIGGRSGTESAGATNHAD